MTISLSDLPRPWISTPLIESFNLSQQAGCRIFLKLENLQPAGSFKSRAMGNIIRNAILHHPTPQKIHFFCASGGNAGLACVTAARTLGCPATVVVPLTTKPLVIAKIIAAGATDCIQYGVSLKEADEYMREVIMTGRAGAVYVPPFDHPDAWTGNSTIIDELIEKPDVIVCSAGGGGLLCGIQMGLDRKGWSDVSVLAMETQGAHSLHQSLKEGRLITLDSISSIATSLGCKRVAPKAFELAQRPNVKSIVLSDAEAAMGCWRIADDERVLVEPACGVSVAPCYDGRLRRYLPALGADSKVVIVLCGGNLTTLEGLNELRDTYAGLFLKEDDVAKVQAQHPRDNASASVALKHMQHFAPDNSRLCYDGVQISAMV